MEQGNMFMYFKKVSLYFLGIQLCLSNDQVDFGDHEMLVIDK